MYYDHFGLKQAPFKITPNTEFFYSGGNRGPVLEALVYAITHGEGIVKVTGEVGSGKTMLCNMLQDRLPDHVESVYLANPRVAADEVLHAIAFELQLGLERRADRLEVMHVLQDYLVRRHAEGKRVVVFIEESQSMPLATLEEIRLLSNLETRNDKLLQIVLFGQPELDQNLRRSDIRQLRDRIAHSFRLDPLGDADIREYLNFRMRAAGYRGPEIFSPPVVKQIAKASSGLTRRINLIADKALLAAFSENTHTIDTKHVRAALRDSEFGPEANAHLQGTPTPAMAWAALALVVGAGLGAALFAAFDRREGPPASPAATTAPAASAKAATPVPAAAPAAVAPAAAAPAVQTAADAGVPIAVPDTLARPASSPGSVAASVAPAVAQIPERPASTLGGAQPAAFATGDVILDRLNATQHWLNAETGELYSVQLAVVSSEEQLRKSLKALPKFIEINDIYMYRGEAQGRPVINVLWGSHPSRQEAQHELEELPSSWRTGGPYIRTLSGIRAEVDRYASRRSR